MAGQDVVYANLAGQLEQQAWCIVTAMEATGPKRLIFIRSMGVYDEVPGERTGSILDPYRNATRVIEDSDLDYTILRPPLVEQSGRNRLWDHAKGRSVPQWLRDRVAKERGRSRGQVGNDPRSRNSLQPGGKQGVDALLSTVTSIVPASEAKSITKQDHTSACARRIKHRRSNPGRSPARHLTIRDAAGS